MSKLDRRYALIQVVQIVCPTPHPDPPALEWRLSFLASEDVSPRFVGMEDVWLNVRIDEANIS